jgi:hypothetical protein
MNRFYQRWAHSAGNQLHLLATIAGPVKLGLLVYLIFAASVQARTNVTLAWNPIANPLVAGFNVYYGGASGICTNKIDAGLNSSVTISNLTAGATYYFALTTYSSTGAESALSPAVSYAVPPQPAVQLAMPSANQFVLTITGVTGHSYAIQASQDLVNWTVIGTVTPGAGGSVAFTDSNAAGYPSRFYRTLDTSP